MDSSYRNLAAPLVWRTRRRFGWLLKTIRGALGALALAGPCTACVVEPDYVVATNVPPDVEVYPHTVYDGRVVYLVNDRWYYRGPEHQWVYYREVPAPLYERRTTLVRERPYVQAAPPAPRHVVAAPPAHHHYYVHERRRAPEVRSPEPATQVR